MLHLALGAGITLARATSTSVIMTVLNQLSTWVLVGGGIWGIWGGITMASGLHDHNGPGIQSGLWQLAGAAIICALAGAFKTLV